MVSVKFECESCETEYHIDELRFSEGDKAYECPNCGGCYFAIVRKEGEQE